MNVYAIYYRDTTSGDQNYYITNADTEQDARAFFFAEDHDEATCDIIELHCMGSMDAFFA